MEYIAKVILIMALAVAGALYGVVLLGGIYGTIHEADRRRERSEADDAGAEGGASRRVCAGAGGKGTRGAKAAGAGNEGIYRLSGRDI